MNTEKSIVEKQTKINQISNEITFWKRAAVLFILLGFILPAIYHNGKLQLNEFGDYIGGTTGSLWGLAGLILVYVAFLGQKQQLLYQEIEIALNREELQLTREELKGQKEELAKQNELFELQRFESTFFNLLKALNEIVNGFEITKTKTNKSYSVLNSETIQIITTGRNCFNDYCKELMVVLDNRGKDLVELIDEYFMINHDIVYYFNNIYLILNFIHQSNIEEKKFYSDIVFKRLSPIEFSMFLYFSLSKEAPVDLKNLLIEYGIFAKIQHKNILYPEHIKLFHQYRGLVDESNS